MLQIRQKRLKMQLIAPLRLRFRSVGTKYQGIVMKISKGF